MKERKKPSHGLPESVRQGLLYIPQSRREKWELGNWARVGLAPSMYSK